jgi:cobalt-zinc-cadmium efflux system outer membrane protein
LFYFLFPNKILLLLARLRVPLAVPLGLALLASSAAAQTSKQSPSLKQALDAAWQVSGPARAESNRRSELAAKEKAANSWISGEPVVGIAHRTDRLNRNQGFREVEAEIELPLWNSGVRNAAQADVSAQRLGFDGQFALAKLKLAGELRAVAAGAAIAEVELDLNKRKLADTNMLAQDLMRRVKAGENARVDALQAQGLMQQAQAAMVQAESQLTRLQNQWRSLTGLATVAPLEETLTSSAANATLAAAVSPDHPALRYAQAQLGSALAKLALADADKRDPMAIGVGVAREQANFAATNDTKLRIALRIPLGGDNRNAARRGAARAELDAAQSELAAVQRQLPTEVTAASAELRATRAAQIAARERTRLSTEVQALIAKSWELGDSDLPTRLRADNEQFEASLSLARATVDVQRAIANLNQAHGLMP